MVLQQCVKHSLVVHLLKSEFHVHETIFLGHVINGQEVKMHASKLETMSKWPILTQKKKVQPFLGFATNYRWFIVNYSAKARPLIYLTKDVPFKWEHAQQQAFDKVQVRFLSCLILTQLDRSLKTISETDAANQAIASILSQYHVINRYKQLLPLDYHAETLFVTDRNWPIHDKELFMIVDCFWKCGDWLVGAKVNVYTDHQGVQCVNAKQKLNSKQASDYIRISTFIYNISYTPGFKMRKAASLSRQSGKEKCGMEAKTLDKWQLQDLENDDVAE